MSISPALMRHPTLTGAFRAYIYSINYPGCSGVIAPDADRCPQAVYAFWQYDLCDVFIEVSKPAFSAADGSAQPALNAHAAREALWLSLDAGLRRDPSGLHSQAPAARVARTCKHGSGAP